MAEVVRTMGKRARMMQVFSVMPGLLAYMTWFSWFNYFSGDPYLAFTETMVECLEPVPVEGECPTGAVFVNWTLFGDDNATQANSTAATNGRCVPAPRHDHDWSLSDRCSDKPYVIKKIADLNGMNQWVGAGLSLAAVFLGGASIDACGRRPVMLMALVVNVGVKAMLFASCYMPWGGFVTVLFVQNAIMIMSSAPVYPAMNAMVADLARGDEVLRGECYSWMEIVNHIADVLAFLAGYPVLALHLGDYRGFWGILCVIAALAAAIFCAVLKETKDAHVVVDEGSDRSADSSEEESNESCFQKAMLESTDGFRAAARDPFLGQFLLIWALTSLAMQGSQGLAQQYAQTFMKMSQENASLCRALWHITLTVGSALAQPLIRRLGARRTMALGLGAMASAWTICGLGPVMPQASLQVATFWGGGLGLGGVAFGLLTPCYNTILSGRVAPELQGKIFAASIIINTCTGLALGLLWPFYFFNPFVNGLRTGVMWLVSAGILLLMMVWLFVLDASEKRKKRKSSSVLGNGDGGRDDASSNGDQEPDAEYEGFGSDVTSAPPSDRE